MRHRASRKAQGAASLPAPACFIQFFSASRLSKERLGELFPPKRQLWTQEREEAHHGTLAGFRAAAVGPGPATPQQIGEDQLL